MSEKEPSFTGKKIEKLRHKMGISQGKLVKRFNDLHIAEGHSQPLTLTDKAVSNWEKGQNRVDGKYIRGLSQIFDRPPYELLFDADELIKPIKLCLDMYLEKLNDVDFNEYADYSEHEFDYIFEDLSVKKRKIIQRNIEGIFGLVGEFDVNTYFLINDFRFLKTPESIQFVKNQLKDEAYKRLDVIKVSMYGWSKKDEVSDMQSFNGDNPFDAYISRKMHRIFSLGIFAPYFLDMARITSNYIGFLKFMSSCGLGNDGTENIHYSSLDKDQNGDYFTYIGSRVPNFEVSYYHSFKKIMLETKQQLQKNFRDIFELQKKEDYHKIIESLEQTEKRLDNISDKVDENDISRALHEAYLSEKDNS
ncbi:helix-turn-helix domain-containing protein [Oenococcus kitaharae]|uniref:Uncharacterized protein n=1 Tax=Oenococcus kitaharae DSM 17330 TaxID=1045004 RepID=G9WJI7_9LACO|nr:helix-turn-helix transcriptional regulator [Oenococcus kitaharae]EHN59032.1 hypothetical protein OKIT_0928 [Oenococcus kitaharae DSM 17330]OEY83741.1 hypothetical protein NT96_05585 [Oenococcus kitaharae]OEY83913.1 hypothetical protein NT95_03425 [Oenococcus kitaharae]OEY84189.1 hypothetical protein NV75_04885 [Oenococcus kitaharae]